MTLGEQPGAEGVVCPGAAKKALPSSADIVFAQGDEPLAFVELKAPLAPIATQATNGI